MERQEQSFRLRITFFEKNSSIRAHVKAPPFSQNWTIVSKQIQKQFNNFCQQAKFVKFALVQTRILLHTIIDQDSMCFRRLVYNNDTQQYLQKEKEHQINLDEYKFLFLERMNSISQLPNQNTQQIQKLHQQLDKIISQISKTQVLFQSLNALNIQLQRLKEQNHTLPKEDQTFYIRLYQKNKRNVLEKLKFEFEDVTFY